MLANTAIIIGIVNVKISFKAVKSVLSVPIAKKQSTERNLVIVETLNVASRKLLSELGQVAGTVPTREMT